MVRTFRPCSASGTNLGLAVTLSLLPANGFTLPFDDKAARIREIKNKKYGKMREDVGRVREMREKLVEVRLPGKDAGE